MVLCDELTSGTEIKSATGLVASALLRLIDKKSHFIFSTHLHSLTQFEDITNNPNLSIAHFRINITENLIEYERKLRKGSGDDTYGIEIANVLGLDSEFIKTAYHYRSVMDDNNMKILSKSPYSFTLKVRFSKYCDINFEKIINVESSLLSLSYKFPLVSAI